LALFFFFFPKKRSHLYGEEKKKKNNAKIQCIRLSQSIPTAESKLKQSCIVSDKLRRLAVCIEKPYSAGMPSRAYMDVFTACFSMHTAKRRSPHRRHDNPALKERPDPCII
jgi:hypothetical protein